MVTGSAINTNNQNMILNSLRLISSSIYELPAAPLTLAYTTANLSVLMFLSRLSKNNIEFRLEFFQWRAFDRVESCY